MYCYGSEKVASLRIWKTQSSSCSITVLSLEGVMVFEKWYVWFIRAPNILFVATHSEYIYTIKLAIMSSFLRVTFNIKIIFLWRSCRISTKYKELWKFPRSEMCSWKYCSTYKDRYWCGHPAKTHDYNIQLMMRQYYFLRVTCVNYGFMLIESLLLVIAYSIPICVKRYIGLYKHIANMII